MKGVYSLPPAAIALFAVVACRTNTCPDFDLAGAIIPVYKASTALRQSKGRAAFSEKDVQTFRVEMAGLELVSKSHPEAKPLYLAYAKAVNGLKAVDRLTTALRKYDDIRQCRKEHWQDPVQRRSCEDLEVATKDVFLKMAQQSMNDAGLSKSVDSVSPLDLEMEVRLLLYEADRLVAELPARH